MVPGVRVGRRAPRLTDCTLPRPLLIYLGLVRDMSGSPASGIPVKVSAKLFLDRLLKTRTLNGTRIGRPSHRLPWCSSNHLRSAAHHLAPHPHRGGWAEREGSQAGG